MGIFDSMFGGGMSIPPRHRSSAFMNLAHQKVPVIKGSVGVCDQDPAPLTVLTDSETKTIGFTTVLEHSTNGENLAIEIDLGREYEIYEIIVHSAAVGGFKKAVTDQSVLLRTIDAGATTTTRDTQVVAGDDAYHASTLHYNGCGIPVQKIQVYTVMNSANKFSADLTEIEVFGC